MRPDRIIVQEVRGGEAMGFLQALASGHSGMTSWHANEGGEWEALAMMVRQHNAGQAVPPDEMYAFLKQFIDVIVWAAKEDRGYKVPRVWLKGVSQQ
jgi:type IV secretion system protein VirB11